MRKSPRSLVRLFLLGSGVGLLLAAGVCGGAALRLRAFLQDLPNVEAPGQYRPPQKTKLFSRDGQLLLEVFRENREVLPLQQVSPYLIQATIALEDRRFYHHHGIDFRGILRALGVNWRAHRIRQGGSTLTQQVARNLYLTHRKTLARKILEMVLALKIERLYSKQEILEIYLNEVFYGHGAHGIRTAAQTYFGKEPGDLTLSESALLAALPRQPGLFSPYRDPREAKRKRAMVLRLMAEQGFITPLQAARAAHQPLALKPLQPPRWKPLRAPYFTTYALQQLMAQYGEDRVYREGLRVYTTLNLPLQAAADQALREELRRSASRRVTQGAIVVLDPHTGEILAMVGGRNFQSQFNRATQARRQPGSAFKPFIYAAAILQGWKPTDTLQDRPFVLRQPPDRVWRPMNYDRRWHGRVTLRTALRDSINVATIRLLDQVGIPSVIQLARLMGIREPLQPYLSLALGASGVSLLNLTSAYGVFATSGWRCEPTALLQVTDQNGTVLDSFTPHRQHVLPTEVAWVMTNMLREVIQAGTGRNANIGLPAGGKTGTTNDGRDAWFIGFTPDFVAGVWVGNDDNTPMVGVWGGNVCAPIWAQVMKKAHALRGGVGSFPVPPRSQPQSAPAEVASRPASESVSGSPASPSPELVRVLVCEESGCQPTEYCPHVRVESFPVGQEPSQICPLHEQPPLVQRKICGDSGDLATPFCPNVVLQSFPAGTEPPRQCSLHSQSDSAPASLSAWDNAAPPAEASQDDTTRLRVCSVSGDIANPRCPHTQEKVFPAGQEPKSLCRVH